MITKVYLQKWDEVQNCWEYLTEEGVDIDLMQEDNKQLSLFQEEMA